MATSDLIVNSGVSIVTGLLLLAVTWFDRDPATVEQTKLEQPKQDQLS